MDEPRALGIAEAAVRLFEAAWLGVAATWLALATALVWWLFAQRREARRISAARTAACAVASAKEFVQSGETPHEAAARIASTLDPHGFGRLSDFDKHTLVAAAHFTEVVRLSSTWYVATLPQGVAS